MNPERKAFDLANAAWLTPVREAFHDFLQAQGYTLSRLQTPPPGGTYPGSHAQAYWECWLAAFLKAREWISADTPPMMHEWPGAWPKSDAVLVSSGDDLTLGFLEQRDGDTPRWTDDDWNLIHVTHWQPLPLPPSACPPEHTPHNPQ